MLQCDLFQYVDVNDQGAVCNFVSVRSWPLTVQHKYWINYITLQCPIDLMFARANYQNQLKLMNTL